MEPGTPNEPREIKQASESRHPQMRNAPAKQEWETPTLRSIGIEQTEIPKTSGLSETAKQAIIS